MQLQIDAAYSLVIVLPSNVPSVKTVTYALRHKMCESRKKMCFAQSPMDSIAQSISLPLSKLLLSLIQKDCLIYHSQGFGQRATKKAIILGSKYPF